MFSCGLDSADVIVGSDLLHKACAACNTGGNEDSPFSISIKVSQLVPNGKIIAFVPSPTCTVQLLQEKGKDLVPSTSIGNLFDFIATKVNPSFSINKAAVQVFASLSDQLSLLQDQIDISEPLLITGNSLGGSIASLFTLRLLDTVYSKPSKRPICITFGSPLLGDNHFQKAISERPSWRSCFLHVVLNQDPIPKLFISPDHSAESASQASPAYKPFGSFLFCSELGCACFDEPESVFELMVAMPFENVGNNYVTELQINHYGLVLGRLRKNAICKGISELGDSVVNPLRVGLTLELEAIGVIKTQQQQDNDTRTLIEKIEKRQQNNDTRTLIEKIEKRQENNLKRKRNVMDATNKLNKSKINMAYLEWYKKETVNQGGYYDGYKNAGSRSEKKKKASVQKYRDALVGYWKDMVEKAEEMPQKEGVSFRTGWLYGGTNFRRMVEPIDIADYYKKGERDYITLARPKCYKLLEEWLHDDKKPSSQTSNPNERQKASLTEDSCFWAHVEEAVISVGVLKDVQTSQENKELEKQNLLKFEDYVVGLIGNCSVSPEIFLPNSTFMKWWKEYKEYKDQEIIGTSHNSLLADFMRNEYQGYI